MSFFSYVHNLSLKRKLVLRHPLYFRYNFIVNAMRGRLEKRSRLDKTTYHKMPGCYYLQRWRVPLESRRVFVGVNCNLQNDNAVALSLGNAIIPSTSGKVSIFLPRVLHILYLNKSVKVKTTFLSQILLIETFSRLSLSLAGNLLRKKKIQRIYIFHFSYT